MKLIVKIEEEDVSTFLLLANSVGIQTQLVDVLFSTEAMEKLVNNYLLIVKGQKYENVKGQ